MQSFKTLGWVICFLLGFFALAGGAEYPTRAITLINPIPPGGTLDLQSRAFASVAEKVIGQPIVVVNKPGATGMIGGLAGAQAAPDGYTLTVGSVNLTNAIEWEIANGRKPPFTRHDFIFICSFTLSPSLLIVGARAITATMRRCPMKELSLSRAPRTGRCSRRSWPR